MYLLPYVVNTFNVFEKMPFLVIRFPVNLSKIFEPLIVGELQN